MSPSSPRSILLVMMSAVGDAVHVLPVASALRRAFPEARLSWLLQPGPYELVRGHPAVDDFILFHRSRARRGGEPGRGGAGSGPEEGAGPGGGDAGPTGAGSFLTAATALRSLARSLPGGRFDLLLALQVYLKAGIFTALAPAALKLGFDRRRARELNWLFTTHRIPPHPQGWGHVQDQYFEFLRWLGVDPEPLEYGLTLTPEERAAQEAFFARVDRPACAVVVGTSRPDKDWRAEGWARVLEEVEERHGLRAILVGGSSRRERETARRILARTGARPLEALGGGLRRLLWLLDRSALVLAPDTGPLHMARALDVPVVGVYGSTNPKRYGPYRRYGELVVDGYARYPGEAYPVSPARRREGMERITPEMVLEKVDVAMARYGRTRRTLTPPPPSPPPPGARAPGWPPGAPPGTSPPRR